MDYIRIKCLTLFQKGVCPINPLVSPWNRSSFLWQKYVKYFPAYLRSRKELHSSVFEELYEHRFFFKKIIQQIINGTHYNLDIHQYSHTKCYWTTFPCHHLPLISKISKRKTGAIKYAQALKDGKISENICFLFDEFFYKICEEYFGGELNGSDEYGELYKGIVCFMIVV